MWAICQSNTLHLKNTQMSAWIVRNLQVVKITWVITYIKAIKTPFLPVIPILWKKHLSRIVLSMILFSTHWGGKNSKCSLNNKNTDLYLFLENLN